MKSFAVDGVDREFGDKPSAMTPVFQFDFDGDIICCV